jgi:hypothetical protein
VTIVAIVLIASLAIYSNEFFASTQKNLNQHILPIENASRQISGVVASFIARQESVMASDSLTKLSEIASTAQLELDFDQNWQQITRSIVDSQQGTKITDSLLDYYKQFLGIDSYLLELVKHHHRMQQQMQLQIETVARLEQKIQNQVEFISGRINLQLSRSKREIRLAKQHSENATEGIEEEFQAQGVIQKLSHTVGINTLRITNVTAKIIQANNSDSLVSIRGNDVQQYASIL